MSKIREALVREYMKSFNHLFEIAVSDETILSSLQDASKRKKDRENVKRILENQEKYIKKFREWLLNGDYKPLKHVATVINDGFLLKKRVIIQPYFFPEQWVQHVVVKTLQPIFMRGMYDFTCGSIPCRGIHHGKKYLEKFIRNNKSEIKYVLKLDIRHFYESVNIDLLKARFKSIIHDERMLNLIFFVLDSNSAQFNGETIQQGLPIGFYTSQWFANWFLQPFDHFVKENLKIKCYVRYMDDIVIFGRNKKELHQKFEKIKEYLAGMDLTVKDNYQIFRFDYIDKNGKRRGRFIDFMGFKFYRDKTTIRGKIFIRAVRKARKIKSKKNPTWYDASQILSYTGWFKKTSTYKAYQKYIVQNVNLEACKDLIRHKDKKGGKRANKMDKGGKPNKTG